MPFAAVRLSAVGVFPIRNSLPCWKILPSLEFINDKFVDTKLKSFLIESGYNSLTNFFLKKNYNIFIVNRNGEKFSLNKMKDSQTFAYANQDKFLISDNHIRKYLTFSNKNKIAKSKQVWGKYE